MDIVSEKNYSVILTFQTKWPFFQEQQNISKQLWICRASVAENRFRPNQNQFPATQTILNKASFFHAAKTNIGCENVQVKEIKERKVLNSISIVPQGQVYN